MIALKLKDITFKGKIFKNRDTLKSVYLKLKAFIYCLKKSLFKIIYNKCSNSNNFKNMA